MVINTKTKQIELTPSLEEYVTQKIEATITKLTKPEERDSILCDVEIAKTTNHHQNGPFYYAEANLSLAGEQYRATAHAESPEAAIDQVKDELFREVDQGRAKKRDIVRRSALRLKNMLRFGRGR